MALHQSALLGVLEMVKTADAGELMRTLLGTMLQDLVDAEATVRNVLAKVSKGDGEMVPRRRTIFAQPNPDAVRGQLGTVAAMLEAKFPAVAVMLRDAKTDLTAFADFLFAHWRKIWSTNPLERLDREIKRRTDVVGIFSNTAALLRLSACVFIEAHDEWQDSDRRYLSEESMALLFPSAPIPLPAGTTTATGVNTTRQLATA